MQILPRWRSLLILNNTLTQSARLGVAATDLASLHSSNALFQKKKSNSGVPRDGKPSKAYKKYIERRKRADTKKALDKLMCSSASPEKLEDFEDKLNKKFRIKPAHHTKSADPDHTKLKRKHRRKNQYDDHDDEPEEPFFAGFGNGSSWNFRNWEQRYQWKERSDWSNDRSRFSEQETRSRTDSQSFTLRTYADRKTLGLPVTGPLKIEDVKAAFRSSALKWHPDRHQGPSQAAAEEKFKHCADAYKSLCDSLSESAL